MTLEDILRESADRHKHLCPRQVLGARMSLYAGELLGLELPRADKRLLVTSETDGCAVDGIIAATFTDTHTEASIRIVPRQKARDMAVEYAQQACNRWMAMLKGYQVMPADKLFAIKPVQLNVPLVEIISNPSRKTVCETCEEEIINGREIIKEGITLCRACAGEGYYHDLTIP